MTLNALLLELNLAIAASEEWAKLYAKAPKAFRRVKRAERELEAALKTYFAALPNRVQRWVNWSEYNMRQIRADDLTVSFTDNQMASEEDILFTIVYPSILEAYMAGLAAGEELYKVDIGTSAVSDYAMLYAKDHTGELVKGLNQTTLNRVRRSLETSLKMRETNYQAAIRVTQIIGDSERALLIARTEAVRSYGAGALRYARDSDSSSKQWFTAYDPCPICVANEGDDIIGLGEEFSSGDLAQPAHPRCKCSVSYYYGVPPGADSSSGADWQDVIIDE